jgi:tetratricopeptide (TPR) repeat protein
MPATTWLELIRNLESQQNFEPAVTEYERLTAAYPAQKESLFALLSAGRLYLKKLNRLDWEANIKMGIQAAEEASKPLATGALNRAPPNL